MHSKRIIVAAILVPLFYLYVMHLPAAYFLFLLVLISTIGLIEFYGMFEIEGMLKYTGVFLGAALLTVFFTVRQLFVDALLFAVLAVLFLRLMLKRNPSLAHSEVATLVLGLFYVPGLLSFQISLVRNGPVWIILLYAAVWSADSMAYYIGKGFGRRKLYEEISPNKTVEGAFGSVLGGVLGAAVVDGFLFHRMPFSKAVILGAAVGIATIAGDLVESMFKRDAGVKDSSHILPGHGGVLDKIDGFTFATPVFYWLCLGLRLIQ
jgi:phosphatidate cytidylyltransferase